MKKSLLTILGASFFASMSFAQVVDTTYDVTWYDTLNSQFCVKLDPSNAVLGLKGLGAEGVNWKGTTNTVASNDVTVGGGKLSIVHKRLAAGDNWTDITLVTTDWVGGSGIKFGPKADTLAGMYVDMNGDVKVQATISATVACEIRLDLADVNGHNGNSNTQRYALEAGAGKNYEFDFTGAWEGKMFDFYSGDFYGISNGRYGASQLKAGVAGKDSVTITYGAQAFIPCRTDGINRLSFTINDAAQGTVDEEITVVISNLTVGNPAAAVNFVPYTAENVEAGKIAFNPAKVITATYGKSGVGVPNAKGITSASALEVYPNPAKGQITVNEDVTVKTVGGVATAVSGTGVLDISSLVAGTYYVVGTTGTATLVVE